MAPAFRFQANLPFKFWGDFVLTVYLINKIPSPILGNPTHSERLLHKPLANYIYVYFVIFAMPRPYLGMGLNLMQDLDSRPYIFTDYPFGIKGYKLFDFSLSHVYEH